MKQIDISELLQVYSQSILDRPSSFWSIRLKGSGVPSELIDRAFESTNRWSGWGFALDNDSTMALLLFEDKADAMLMELSLGEQYEYN